MGTSLDQLHEGSSNFVFVASIEGCSILLHNHTNDAAVLTAWAGTDWATSGSAYGGLFVEWKSEQRLNPDEPFTSGGTCTLHVAEDPAGSDFGMLTARRASGGRTYLTATLDRDDTTASVKSAAWAASSGDVHCGTECIGYASKSATSFLTLTRGKYAVGQTGSGGRFAQHHRVTTDANAVNLQPAVTQYPRQWVGRWVEVYMHRVVGGVLDVKSEAHLAFAGRIDELRDDPNTGARVIHLTHVLDAVRDITIGSGMWSGLCQDGVYLTAGMTFGWSDRQQLVGSNLAATATSLTVVAGTPSGTTQIKEGWYSHVDLCTKLTQWLQGQTGLLGDYRIAYAPLGAEFRIKIYWTLTGVGVAWTFDLPSVVATFFGYTEVGGSETEGNVTYGHSDVGKVGAHKYPDNPPNRISIALNGDEASRVRVGGDSQAGTIADQANDLPASVQNVITTGEAWGVFVIGERTIVRARINNIGLSTQYLDKLQPFIQRTYVVSPWLNGDVRLSITIDSNSQASIRQIYVFESSLKNVLMRMIHSTGTETFNHATRDTYPLGAGAAIPWSLGGTLLSASIDDVPGSTGALALVIDKPTKLSELLKSDLIMRWAFLYFHEGTLRLGSWKAPSAASAVYTLDETNKADASGTETNPRTATAEHRDWHKPITRIRYNRSIANLGSDEYASRIGFIDGAAIDDAGGEGATRTLSLRNTYSEFSATGASIESLAPGYLALMPLISRPANVMTRSLNAAYAFRLHVGEVVLFSDEFARDPTTGTRGITARPALVTRIMFTPGGATPGSDQPGPITGEVDLYFTDQDTERAGVVYVPSADIDDTASTGGFTSGYNSSVPSIRLYDHRYSESTEAVDASHLPATSAVLIIERDPVNPDSPLYWERTVSSQSGNDLTLSGALTSPTFDTAKKYRVLFGTWANATTTQKLKSYQADDADGLIVDDAQPFLYAALGTDSTYTANTSTEIELIPAMAYGEGFGRDVGTEAALIRAADNFTDYKSAIQAPMLWAAEVSNTDVTGTDYKLVECRPVFLTREYLTNAVYRTVSIAPWARSTDGTSTKIRVSLCRDRPSGTSLTNVSRGSMYASYEWSSITNTTAAIQTAQPFLANIKDSEGRVFLLIELGYKCASWGIAQFVEGVRQVA